MAEPKEVTKVDVLTEEYFEEEEIDRSKLQIILASVIAVILLIALIACLIIIAPKLMCQLGIAPATDTEPTFKASGPTPTEKPTSPRLIFNVTTIERLNFTDAAESCEKSKSRLAFPRSVAEEAEIDSELKKIIKQNRAEINSKCGDEFFIGLRRSKAREWESNDGTMPIFAPPLIADFYTTYDYADEHCVQMFFHAKGILNNIPCNSFKGIYWPCYICEYNCVAGNCEYTLDMLKNATTRTYYRNEVELQCAKDYKDGMLATVHHKRVMDKIYAMFKNSTCDKPLIGNRYTVLYEDIYENPLLYRTTKIYYGGKTMDAVCVSINVARKPYRWTINRCTEKLCFLCYTND